MDKREEKMLDKRVEDAKGNMQVDKQEERMVDKQKDKLVDKQEDKELTGWTRLMSAMNVEKTAVHRQEAAGRSKLSGKVGNQNEKVENFFCRTETVTERMEDGWARVSERVVEVVIEEVFFLVLFRFPNQFVAVHCTGDLNISFCSLCVLPQQVTKQVMEQEDEENCLRECQDKCKRGNVREDKETKKGAANAKPITVIDIEELEFDSEAGDKDKDSRRQVDQLNGDIQPGDKLEEAEVDQSIESLALDSLGHIEQSRHRNENWSENFEWLEPGVSLPLLEAPLPTGVACCLTRY